ncbi:MAG: rod shape-determining protein MreD [Syntrophomonadaceae bacterium]|nr:rod shape-determining protein MreD [Syntrophomonadaceae bacterium]
MKRFGILTLLVIGSFLLQSTLLDILPLRIKPDLILILVIFFSLLNGRRHGLIMGVTAGLLQDLLRGRLLGMNLLALALTGWVVGLLEDKVYKENILVPILVVFLATLLHALAMVILSAIAGLHLTLLTGLYIGVVEALYNTFLVPLFYGRFFISSTRGALSSVTRPNTYQG